MYFPKSQIKPSQFTNGGELREKVTKNEYRGYFFQTSTNLFYSGKYPEDSPIIELERIPQISTGNNNEELFSDEGADDFVPNEPVSVVEETNYFNLPRAYLESNSTVLRYTKPPRRPIQSQRFKDTTANDLTKTIIWDMYHVRGGAAYRINNGAVYDKKRNVYRKGVQRKGIPDIIGIIDGKFYGIEVKIGKDRQSADQKEIEKEINDSGGVYFIAKSYDDYLSKIK